MLRDDGKTEEDLKARNPEANITPISHNVGKKVSQDISTAASLEDAKMYLGLAKERDKKKKIA